MDENIISIREWMAGDKDFAVGLALLHKVCRNRNIIDWVTRKGDRKDTRDKIEYELQKILPVEAAKDVVKPLPDFIIAIKERLAVIANRRSEVHRLMEELGDSNEVDVVEKRKGFVEEIEALTNEYNTQDGIKEEYFTTGKVPTDPESEKGSAGETEMTDAQKITRLNNLRASKSKWLKKEQTDPKVIARLLEIQTEMDTLEPLVAAILKK